MKCDYCDKKIKDTECSHCKELFEKDQEVLCYDDEHFCDSTCLFEFMLRNNYGVGYGNAN